MSQTIRLFSRWGSLFGGETGTYPDDVAEMLVREKRGKRVLSVDANGNQVLEPWAGEEEGDGDEVVSRTEQLQNLETQKDSGFVFDPAKDPFMLDGLDEPTSTALHVAGLHTPGDVETYITSGKVLTELTDIGAARAKKITELYGVK
jgi:hypothetical protein